MVGLEGVVRLEGVVGAVGMVEAVEMEEVLRGDLKGLERVVEGAMRRRRLERGGVDMLGLVVCRKRRIG